MNELESYVKMIIDKEEKESMESLEHILLKSLSYLKDHCEDLYDELSLDLYVLANGECITKDDAIKYVDNMKPVGTKWGYDQVMQVANQYGISFDSFSPQSLFWAMNMLYNDYHQVLGNEVGSYVKMARAFLNDEDAPDGDAKVFRYIRVMK